MRSTLACAYFILIFFCILTEVESVKKNRKDESKSTNILAGKEETKEKSEKERQNEAEIAERDEGKAKKKKEEEKEEEGKNNGGEEGGKKGVKDETKATKNEVNAENSKKKGEEEERENARPKEVPNEEEKKMQEEKHGQKVFETETKVKENEKGDHKNNQTIHDEKKQKHENEGKAAGEGENSEKKVASKSGGGLRKAERETRLGRRRKNFAELLQEKRKQSGGNRGKWKAKLNEKFALLSDKQLKKLNGAKKSAELFGYAEGENNKKAGNERLFHHKSLPLKSDEPELKLVREFRYSEEYVDTERASDGAEGGGEGEKTDGSTKRSSNTEEITCKEFLFDIRDKWPQCDQIINNVRDQSICASCWAVSASSAFSDRRCIEMAKKGMPIEEISDADFFSAYDTAVCSDGAFDRKDACNGGAPTLAWRWYARTGVVSGNNFSTGGCVPYPLRPTAELAEENNNKTQKALLSSCSELCTHSAYGNDSAEYTLDKNLASSWSYMGAYNTSLAWEQIMKDELLNNGTINAVMVVYEDFQLHYSSGVYAHISGEIVGNHAIRLIGYGNETCTDGSSQKFWLGVNSWGEEWGDRGFFKIARGIDEAKIESMEVAFGTPIVEERKSGDGGN